MFGMNQEQVLGLLRQILPVFGGIAVTLGWLTTGQVADATGTILQIAGPAMIVGSTVWSLFSKTQARMVSAVANMPEVQGIKLESTVAGRALADETPSNVSASTPAAAQPSKTLGL